MGSVIEEYGVSECKGAAETLAAFGRGDFRRGDFLLASIYFGISSEIYKELGDAKSSENMSKMAKVSEGKHLESLAV